MSDSLLCFVENGTAVHMFAVRFRHSPSSGLRAEESFVTMFLELYQEIVVVLLCLHFLISTNEKYLRKYVISDTANVFRTISTTSTITKHKLVPDNLTGTN